jgi:hypothetical protein
MAQIEQFNLLAEEFAQKMIKTFPNEKKLAVWYVHFKTTKQISPKTPVEYFMQSLMPYGVQIMTRDAKFFKENRDMVDYAESFSNRSGLTNIWDDCSEEVKDSIWGYMQSLYVLGMTGLGYHDQLQTVLADIQRN